MEFQKIMFKVDSRISHNQGKLIEITLFIPSEIFAQTEHFYHVTKSVVSKLSEFSLDITLVKSG